MNRVTKMNEQKQTKKKMTRKEVKSLIEELNALPKVENENAELSKTETIKMLAKSIGDMFEKGYTYSDVVNLLNNKGLEINVPTLKSYLLRAKGKNTAGDSGKAEGKKKGTQGRGGKASQNAASSKQVKSSEEESGIQRADTPPPPSPASHDLESIREKSSDASTTSSFIPKPDVDDI